MTDEETQAPEKPRFKAKVTVYVRLTIEVEPEGDEDLPLRAARNRAAAEAYRRIREAVGIFAEDKPAIVEVIA